MKIYTKLECALLLHVVDCLEVLQGEGLAHGAGLGWSDGAWVLHAVISL